MKNGDQRGGRCHRSSACSLKIPEEGASAINATEKLGLYPCLQEAIKFYSNSASFSGPGQSCD